VSKFLLESLTQETNIHSYLSSTADNVVEGTTDIIEGCTNIESTMDIEGATDAGAQTQDIKERADLPGEEDPDDNAGDADAAGDGSAYVGEMFIGYDNPEDHEDLPGPISEKETPLPDSNEPSVLVLGMPVEDLVCVILDSYRTWHPSSPGVAALVRQFPFTIDCHVRRAVHLVTLFITW
jgi:hypothetical protein